MSSLFGNRQEANLKTCEQMVEAVLTARGLDAARHRIESAGGPAWGMTAGSAECRQHFAVAKGGWLEVMPEPLVPHRGCRYRQTTKVEVEPGGGLFFADLFRPFRL